MDLMDAPSEKLPLSGTDLCKELGGEKPVKPGPWMKPALDVCMAWRFRNPGVEDLKGAIDEVRSRSEELKIPMPK
jgi:tRNA nucleotidyltransferase (CCA-adding enzyme)